METITLEEKCEHMMNVVVESRKTYGKMCVEYNQKKSLVENKILKQRLKTVSNTKFKSKNHIPQIDFEGVKKDFDSFTLESLEWQNRIEKLKKNVKNLQTVVQQLKEDRIGKRLREPLTAQAMLADVKNEKKI